MNGMAFAILWLARKSTKGTTMKAPNTSTNPSKVLTAACAAGLTVSLATPVATAGETERMRVQAAVPSGSLSFEILEEFADRVGSATNGRIDVEILSAGAIVSSDQILDAVDAGQVEAGFAWPQFWSGHHPATALFSNTPVWPAEGLDQLTHFAWFYEGGGKELYSELMQEIIGKDIVSFPVTASGWQPLGWTNEEIETFDDFKSLRYRSPPGLIGEIFEEAGVSTVFLGPEELVPAAERGVVDMAGWINPVEDYAMGFHDVFDYYYLSSVHQFVDVGELVVNSAFYEGLSEADQSIIATTAQSVLMESYLRDIHRNSEMLETLQEQHGVTLKTTPADINTHLLEAAERVLAQRSDDDEFFATIVDAQRDYADTANTWWGEVLGIYGTLRNAE